MTRGAVVCGVAVALAAIAVAPAQARPPYNMAFKAHYKTADGKPKLNAANCGVCHVGMPRDAKWNPYGEAVREALGAKGVTDQAKVIAALKAAEAKKSPGGKTYVELIQADQLPGAPGGGNASAAGGGGATRAISGTWTSLFNGRDMSGWHKMNQGNWTVTPQGTLMYTGGGNGWLRSDKQYKNYSLVITWRYTKPGNNDAGIFLRAGMEGNPWPNGGVQLNMGPGDNLGSIGGTQGSRARADLIKAAGPNGEWNTYAVTVQNGVATLAINGTPAWEMATGIPDRPGYIGIQNENFPLEIQSVDIMELP